MAADSSWVNASVSHGTLREDGYATWDDVVSDILMADPKKAEEFGWLVNETLFNALNDAAPEGCSFGTHEGDGSDFGFWSDEGEDESEGDD